MGLEIVFEGVSEFMAGLDLIAAQAAAVAEANLTEATAIIERQAKINAHTGEHGPGEPHIPGTGPGPNKVSGNLIGAIQASPPVTSGLGVFEAEVGVTTEAPYSVYLEGGRSSRHGGRARVRPGRVRTSGLGGNGQYPFFGTAVDGSLLEIEALWADGYRRMLGG